MASRSVSRCNRSVHVASVGRVTATSAGAPPRAIRQQRSAWVLVAVIWAGYFLVRALGAPEEVENLAKALLMPTLLVWVLVALRAAAPLWLVLGLIFATVGDIAIIYVFELGILGFLVMQLCYIVGFISLGAVAGLRARWPVALGYVVIWLAVNLGLGEQFGDLRIPILVYSLAICVMGALAAGVGARVGIGAALFLISDMFIAFGEVDIDFTGRAALIMPTYLAAQYLIATGWARRVDPNVVVPA